MLPDKALLPQHGGKVGFGAGLPHGVADRGPHLRIAGGLAPALGLVEGAGCLAARLLQHRQLVLAADRVRGRPQLGVLAAALLILFAVHIGHRVDDEVVVQAVCVLVGGHQHLEPPAPHPPRQLHPDGVALFRSYLAGLETLVGMQRHRAAGLAEPPLHRPHVRPGLPGLAVKAGDQQHLLAVHIGGGSRVLASFSA